MLWDTPYTELDSLFHGENWTKLPSFEADAEALAAGDRWITEWGYWSSGVKQLLAGRAQLLVWLDLPRRVALPRLIRRTVRRRVLREELWNGNVEPPLHTFFTRPDDNIIRWEMKTHDKWRERMPSVIEEFPHLEVVRVGTARELEAWLSGPASGA